MIDIKEKNTTFQGEVGIVGGQADSGAQKVSIVEPKSSLVDIKSERKYRGLRKPWKEGESGNPKGRPKKAQSITAQLEQEAKRKVKVVLGGQKFIGSNMEILAKRMFDRAIRKVEPRLCSEIIDRVDGRAVSSLELVGRNGEPVKIVVQYDGNQRA